MSDYKYTDIVPQYRRDNKVFSIIKQRSKRLKVGSTAMDVGSHSGFMTNMLEKIVGPNGRVIAFEPNFYYIPYIMTDYRFRDNVTIYPFALSNKRELVKVKHSFDLPDGDTLFDEISYRKENSYEIHLKVDSIAVPLDDIEPQLNISNLDFIKTNCEGYETNVLLGAQKTLMKYKPDILIVSHELMDGTNTKFQCEEILKNLGYNVEFLKERSSHVFASFDPL